MSRAAPARRVCCDVSPFPLLIHSQSVRLSKRVLQAIATVDTRVDAKIIQIEIPTRKHRYGNTVEVGYQIEKQGRKAFANTEYTPLSGFGDDPCLGIARGLLDLPFLIFCANSPRESVVSLCISVTPVLALTGASCGQGRVGVRIPQLGDDFSFDTFHQFRVFVAFMIKALQV